MNLSGPILCVRVASEYDAYPSWERSSWALLFGLPQTATTRTYRRNAMDVIINSLSSPALIMVRRLRVGPLTEFELASEVACHSSYSPEQAADQLAFWIKELFDQGLIWSGVLSNRRGQNIVAAALTNLGMRVVGDGISRDWYSGGSNASSNIAI